jgi:hypothetical protein
MLKLFVCAIFILPSLFSCSKEPTAPSPFTLYADNKTKYNYAIFVNEEHEEDVEKYAKKYIGYFAQDQSVHLQAKTDGYTDFDVFVANIENDSYTWTLIVSSFTLYVENLTNEDVQIYVAYTYAGICPQSEKLCMGDFPQTETTLMEAYGPFSPGHYWCNIIRTIGKDEYTWTLRID